MPCFEPLLSTHRRAQRRVAGVSGTWADTYVVVWSVAGQHCAKRQEDIFSVRVFEEGFAFVGLHGGVGHEPDSDLAMLGGGFQKVQVSWVQKVGTHGDCDFHEFFRR